MISDTLEAIATNIENAYDELETKGATLPANKNIENLADTIATIQSGGGEDVEKFWVEFRDIDGTLIEKQWVEKNGQVTIPSTTPNYDSTYLEFDEWTPDGDLTNVKHNILAIATYKSKVDTVTGYRPTIYKCAFDSSALSPVFAFKDYNATNFSNAYIDYGDGTVEQITATAMPHTYASAGDYIIKIYGDKYYLSNNTNKSVFNNGTYNYNIALKKFYIGENATIGQALGNSSYKLEVLNIPTSVTAINGDYILMWCDSLKVFCTPRTLTTLGGDIGSTASGFAENVKYLVFGNSEIKVNGIPEINSRALEHLVLPAWIINNSRRIGCNLKKCVNLKDLIFPDASNNFVGGSLTLANAIVEELDFSNYNYLPNIGNMYNLYALRSIKFPAQLSQTISSSSAFNNMPLLEELIIPDGVNISSWGGMGSSNTRIKRLVLPNTVTGTLTIGANGVVNSLIDLELGNDWQASINLQHARALTNECLLNIALNLKDLTGATAKTIKFYNGNIHQTFLQNTYILNGEVVDSATTGAITIEAYIQSKNWTVSYGSV